MESVRSDFFFVAIGTAGALLLLACAFRIVALNRGSQNLILSYGAVIGIVVAFFVSCFFELKSRSETTNFGLTCPIDRQDHKIGSAWLGEGAPALPTGRLEFDIFTSAWLGDNSPASFDGDTEKLASDYTIFCILGFFADGRNHWNLERLDVRGQRSVSSFFMSRGRKGKEAGSFIPVEVFTHRLAEAGNVFSGALSPFLAKGFSGLSAPPDTALKILPTSITLAGPVCSVEFHVLQGGVVGNLPPIHPRPLPKSDFPEPVHGARFETYDVRVSVVVKFNSLRSKSWLIDDYHQWASSIVEGARIWLEGA